MMSRKFRMPPVIMVLKIMTGGIFMVIKTIRSAEQIGGNIISISTDKAHIILDAGTELPPINGTASDDISVEGLTEGKPGYDAVFISHHHEDHCGLVNRILPEIPVYCGKETERILNVIADFTGQKIRKFRNFTAYEKITVGNIEVIPINTVHSAKDSYMFLITMGDTNILYTGDFCDFSEAEEFLKERHINVLITEGTNIGRKPENGNITTEKEAEEQLTDIFGEYDGTAFVLCSSANENRIMAVINAADRTGRVYYEDIFTAALRQSERKYKFVPYYVKEDSAQYKYFRDFKEKNELIGAETLARIKGKKVIFVRRTMLPFIEKYLKYSGRSKKNVLIYSIWNGYVQNYSMADFLDGIRRLDIDIRAVHCSGHAYYDTLRGLIDMLDPDVLLPVHCEKDKRKMFSYLHENCYFIKDGERFWT